MSVLEAALELAKQKVRFFPVVHNAKVPAIDRFSERATSNADELKKIFSDFNYNSGIACGRVDENLYLVGLDIDNKDGKNGYQVLNDYEDVGLALPDTWSQKTPTGGEHRLYWSDLPIRQGTSVLGPGVDLRGDGGYLVGPGSKINGKLYTRFHNTPIAMAPEWFKTKFRKPLASVIELWPKDMEKGVPVKDQVLALKRSIAYLTELPIVTSGNRNTDCYKVVCKMKDFGLDRTQMLDVLNQFWKCEPMLDDAEMSLTIASAFKTGKNPIGISAPENIFDTIPKEKEKDFIEDMNERFFFCENRIYKESNDNGRLKIRKYSVEGFHNLLLPERVLIGEGETAKWVKKSHEWMKNSRRRTYDEIRFIPKDKVSKSIYNLWQGFHSKPKAADKVYSKEAQNGFTSFLDHCLDNICNNEMASFSWLMDFVAHLFQKPWEKPPVSVIFQGEKGTGKNAFIDVLHHMIGAHSVTISGKHALTSQFNSLMEDKLLVALDEAFWSGDKGVEGLLKSLITDSKRNIERKGEEPYTTQVYDRIFILGNEDHLVNATSDERRFAVFNVSSKRRGDTSFFGTILDGIRIHGGDEILMDYFLKRDISKFDVRKAPMTEGLRDQKLHSLNPFEEWWQECLIQGKIVGFLSEEENPVWPDQISTSTIIECYYSFLKNNYPWKYRDHRLVIGKKFKKVAPSCAKAKGMRKGSNVTRIYEFVTLDKARDEWNRKTGLQVNWGE